MEELKNSFSLRKLPWGWILLGITLWFLFPWLFSFFFNLIIKNPKEYGESFGAVGDIYGSLNAFVSSIALCAVAYSTWLQVTSLKETRETNKKQLDFAKEAHKAQMQESRNTLFTNKFYSLLNFKNERLSQIKLHVLLENAEGTEEVEVDGIGAIRKLAAIFLVELNKNGDQIIHYEYKELLDHFSKLSGKNFSSHINPIISYFYIYGDLIRLINESEIQLNEKEFFKSILRNSMLQEEKIVFFWLSSIFSELKNSLDNSELFNQFHNEKFHKFALKFHKKSHFKSEGWKDFFDSQQNPA